MALLAVIVLSIVLSRLHTLATPESRTAVLLLAATPLWLVIALGSGLLRLRVRSGDTMPRATRLALAAMAAIFLLSFGRAAALGTATGVDVAKHVFGWSTLALFGLAAGKFVPRWTFRGALLGAVAVYVGLNVALVLWSALTGTGEFGIFYGRASILASLGIETERVLFPTSPGFNSFGTMAGAALAGLLPMLWRTDSRLLRLGALLATLAAVGGLLLADNRAALVAGIATGTGLAMFSPRLLRAATWTPALSPLLPVTFVLMVTVITQLSPSSELIRSAESTGTNVRLEVWNVILHRLMEPSLAHIVGYGYMGHVSSGVSAEYVPVVYGQLAVIPGVASYETALDIRVTAHNFVLQTILDHGYVGAAILLLLLTCLMRQVWRDLRESDRPVDRSMLAILLFMIIVGTTETVFAAYNAEAFGLVLLIAIACAKGDPRTAVREVRWRSGAAPRGYPVMTLAPETKGV
jgi:hypothetical protein